MKLGTWSLGLVVWNSPQLAEWHTCGNSKSRILFLWNYLILHVSNWSVHFFICVLQTLKIVDNIISKLESKGGYMFCYSFIRNSQISHFWHLPFTLKSPPSNTDHHAYFLLIFPMFYINFSFRNALLSIFGNINWTLKTVPPNIIPIFFYDFSPYCIAIFHLTWSHLLYLEMGSGSWKQ